MKLTSVIVAALMWLTPGLAAHATSITLAEAVRTKGTVILIRHALAPGFGDPANFSLTQCATQRNLSNEGRRQARAIGLALKQAGLEPSPVWSSPWCRCLDTASEMNIGPIVPFEGLSSFFEGHASRTETLARLQEKMDQLDPSAPPVIMVTHQVVISALTGQGTRSGGAVLYDPRSKTTFRLSMPEPPYAP